MVNGPSRPRQVDLLGVGIGNVIAGVDGHDVAAVDAALAAARAVTDRPSLICCKTIIGKGAPNKANSHDAHGSPLGDKEIAATRAAISWNHPPFEIPADVYAAWDARGRGARDQAAWDEAFAAYQAAFPGEAAEFLRCTAGALPENFGEIARGMIEQVNAKGETIATRKASQNALEVLGKALPELVGGSADLAGSNLTLWSGSKGVSASGGGNYVYYGVREFGMSAAMNGMALHGGVIPYGGTFLVFSDYARNALRLAALMKIRSIFVFTHDSLGLGEDGPTHQPIEHASSLRLIPGMDVWRPCDTVESAVCWVAAVERKDGPSSLLFSRQNLPFQKRSAEQIADIRRGGYVLSDAAAPRAVIMATGSEIALAVGAVLWQSAIYDYGWQVLLGGPRASTWLMLATQSMQSLGGMNSDIWGPVLAPAIVIGLFLIAWVVAFGHRLRLNDD